MMSVEGQRCGTGCVDVGHLDPAHTVHVVLAATLRAGSLGAISEAPPTGLTVAGDVDPEPRCRSRVFDVGSLEQPGRTVLVGGVDHDEVGSGVEPIKVALDELVVHGWDLAVATGQDFAADDTSLESAQGFLTMFSGPRIEDQRVDAFGPERVATAEAPLLEPVLAMAGRDVNWRP